MKSKYHTKDDRHDRDAKEQGNADLIWGINPIREAVFSNHDTLSEILVQKGKAGPKYQEIIDKARSSKIRVRFVEAGRLGVPSHTKHQGIVARQIQAKLLQLDELLAGIDMQSGQTFPRILALDSIQDPRNMGAILRSALAAGFNFIIMTRERSVPLTGTVARTSAGAISHLRLCQVVNLAETLKVLKQNRFWIFGTVAEPTALSLYDVDFSLPLCLVIGSEGKGIRPLVQKQCDQLVTIPMQGEFNSLNASVAAAVIMFEINRQQTRKS